MGGACIDISGETFGRLTVIERCGYKDLHVAWKCRCECGKITIVSGSELRRGKSRSCGCGNYDVVHGQGKKGQQTRLYRIWNGIKQRCCNPNREKYKDYGSRGITVCDQWATFIGFYNDVSEAYFAHVAIHGEADTSIDRIDNDKGYCPENCRWSTRKGQRANRRDSAS